MWVQIELDVTLDLLFTNLQGNQIVKDYYPTANRLIKFPTADYLFILTFIFHKQKTIEVKVYFSIVEDLI